MIALIQRVSRAEVHIEQQRVAAIGTGVLALIGVRAGDAEAAAERLAQRLLTYRLFPDAHGRMNLSVREVGAALLVVPQFTLAADTNKGTRAGFSGAEQPERARALFDELLDLARTRHSEVATGEFGAHMKVSLENDGPVTFWLETP